MDSATPPPPRRSVPTLTSQIARAGRAKVVALGREREFVGDLYVRAMALKWRHLILGFSISFIAFNLLFAFFYWIKPGSLGDGNRGDATSYLDAFFFSVQTVATIGYGVIFPKTLYANLLVTIEIMSGVLGLAMVTGLMFARFSRPTARIMFSKVAVISPYDGVPTLMFRAANERHNLILEAHVRMVLTRFETSSEGRVMRRFRDLRVERQDNLTFILTWTVMHRIDETSPLYGLSPEEIANSDAEIIVVMTGTDESFSQPVYARHGYSATDIVFDSDFVDILDVADDGTRTINYGRFHDVEPFGPVSAE
ncbi:MAG TPA: ion channel [Alphaproteobacteria bacterium]|nr:ion channel [Alphaproteobacteria bacterium]